VGKEPASAVCGGLRLPEFGIALFMRALDLIWSSDQRETGAT
jgi:hypothetical protein